MTGPALPEGGREGAGPVVALLDCGPDEPAARVAALVELAGRLGMAVHTETVSAGCTTLSVRLAPENARRFQAALLLGGATILPENGMSGAELTIVVTTSARAPGSE